MPDELTPEPSPDARPDVSLATIAREWGRIGCVGFGGPPTHIAMLRKLAVGRERWIDEAEFEDAIAATNLLPGPASTQLAIFCAWRLRGWRGALVGGACFICPGLAVIIVLSAIFLASNPPTWIKGAALGAGAAVAPVAINAALGLLPASWRRAGDVGARQVRWVAYALAGGVAAATVGTWLVLVLLGCGLVEVTISGGVRWPRGPHAFVVSPLGIVATGGLGALAWVALKVGALSFGGGFVIIPLMQADAVHHYHWMTNAQFLNGVALGQITPGPVVQTVSVVGYAAAGVGGALLAALIAFSPSFVFILAGARHFGTLRTNRVAQSFLGGAGPAAIGAIAGASIPLALAIAHVWQVVVLAGAFLLIVGLRRSVVLVLVGAGVIGAFGAALGLPTGG
ncbi:MAG TPA: chromate efflux transporter [Acidimicrobiales bacterium]|nr:chromate efflux transporter [Acidimicrobiales bacterium]